MESVDSCIQHRYRKWFFLFEVPLVTYVVPEEWSVLGQCAVSLAEQLQCRANRIVYPNTRSHISENPRIFNNTAERAPLSFYLPSSHFLNSSYPLSLLIWSKQTYRNSGRVFVRRRTQFTLSAFDLVGRFSYTLIKLKCKQQQTLQFLRIDINNMTDTRSYRITLKPLILLLSCERNKSS
jgi:hypothetical protein